MSGNPLVRFDEGRVGRTFGVAFSPTLPPLRETKDSHAKPPRRKEDRKVRFISNRLRIGAAVLHPRRFWFGNRRSPRPTTDVFE